MAKKKSRGTPAKNVVCNKCMLEGHAPPGTQHRRCSANLEANAPMDKGKKLPPAQRGTWN